MQWLVQATISSALQVTSLSPLQPHCRPAETYTSVYTFFYLTLPLAGSRDGSEVKMTYCFPKEQISVPNTHTGWLTTTCNSTMLCPPWAPTTTCPQTQAGRLTQHTFFFNPLGSPFLKMPVLVTVYKIRSEGHRSGSASKGVCTLELTQWKARTPRSYTHTHTHLLFAQGHHGIIRFCSQKQGSTFSCLARDTRPLVAHAKMTPT